MIPNAVLHLVGEQPLLADLLEFPEPTHSALLCTNVRYMNGKTPIFIEQREASFLFPLGQIRFVEIPEPVAPERTETEPPQVAAGTPVPDELPELEVDEDFLRRIREA